MKTFKIQTVHFVFSLRIFPSAHVMITSTTAPGMFINLCVVVLLLFAGSLVSKFHFQLMKKSPRKVPEKVGHSPIWQMA